MTSQDFKDIINAGGSVMFNGRTIFRLEDVPTDAEIADVYFGREHGGVFQLVKARHEIDRKLAAMGIDLSTTLGTRPIVVVQPPTEPEIDPEMFVTDSSKGFGRMIAEDPRDLSYELEPKRVAKSLVYKHYVTPKALDQEDTSECVAYSGQMLLAAGPVKNKFYKTTYELYKECQKADEWEGECVDMETECLSKRGWLKGGELKIGDTILTFDIESNGLRWMPVEKVHIFGQKAYRTWSQKGFSKAVTDNHKWLVVNRNNGLYPELRRTDELKNRDAVLLAAQSLEQPRISTVDDDFVKLVAWTVTEGSYRPDHRRGNGVVISQKVYEQEVGELISKFSTVNGSYKPDGSKAWELSGTVALDIRKAAPNRAPSMEWLSQLTQRQLRLFIDTCIKGDGNVRQQDSRQDCISFAQLPGERLDAFQMACILAGQPINRAGIDKLSKVETWTLKRSHWKETRHLQPSLYMTGQVWCPQTSAGTFVARRNGNVFITGNSYDGTSVRALMKVLQDHKYIGEYRWAWDIEPLISHLLTTGPVVVGTNWYNSMFYPDAITGFATIRGATGIAGGHAYTIKGVNKNKLCPDGSLGAFRCINSWGTGWGDKGMFWVSFLDMQRLIKENGEAVAPMELKVIVEAQG